MPGFNLFKPATFLDRDTEGWSLETWAWLMRHLGGMDRLRAAKLARPHKDDFAPTEAEGHDRALHIFDRIRALMGMSSWPVDLIEYERRPSHARVAEFAYVRSGDQPNGTFERHDNGVIIRYAADLVAQPPQLIATLAHELSHYLLATIPDPPPGGSELEELATEICVAYVGFGVFAANAAFFFEQHTDTYGQGWKSRRSGYLSERTWAFNLAVFLTLKDETGAAKPWLKSKGLIDMTSKAEAYLAKHPALLAPLRAMP